VSADDVALIENARTLRVFEESLSSATTRNERAQLVERYERCRWFYREQEIDEYASRWTTKELIPLTYTVAVRVQL